VRGGVSSTDNGAILDAVAKPKVALRNSGDQDDMHAYLYLVILRLTDIGDGLTD